MRYTVSQISQVRNCLTTYQIRYWTPDILIRTISHKTYDETYDKTIEHCNVYKCDVRRRQATCIFIAQASIGQHRFPPCCREMLVSEPRVRQHGRCCAHSCSAANRLLMIKPSTPAIPPIPLAWVTQRKCFYMGGGKFSTETTRPN